MTLKITIKAKNAKWLKRGNPGLPEDEARNRPCLRKTGRALREAEVSFESWLYHLLAVGLGAGNIIPLKPPFPHFRLRGPKVLIKGEKTSWNHTPQTKSYGKEILVEGP